MKRVLSLVLLLAMTLGFSGCSPVGSNKITVTALMADSAGLFVGNDVGILGVPVGKVTSITPDGPNVRVQMSINADQPVPAGAGAVVVARSVATDRYVELTPVYHSGPRMRDGAVIAQQLTRTPVDFDDVLGALNTFATGIAGSQGSRDAIKNLLKVGSSTLSGKGREINRAVTSLGGAVNSISGQRGNITATLQSLDTLTGTIAANQQLVRRFVDEVSQATGILADERTNFQSALGSLSQAVSLVADFAHRNRQQLVTALGRSSTLMTSLLSKRTQLAEILRVMPLALQNLQNVVHNGRILIRIDPAVLFPGGQNFSQFCSALPLDVCTLLGPSLLNLRNLLALVGVRG